MLSPSVLSGPESPATSMHTAEGLWVCAWPLQRPAVGRSGLAAAAAAGCHPAPVTLACVSVPSGVAHENVAEVGGQLDEGAALAAEGHLQVRRRDGRAGRALASVLCPRLSSAAPGVQTQACPGSAGAALPPRDSRLTWEKSLAAARSGFSRAAASSAAQCRPPLLPRTVGMRGLRGWGPSGRLGAGDGGGAWPHGEQSATAAMHAASGQWPALQGQAGGRGCPPALAHASDRQGAGGAGRLRCGRTHSAPLWIQLGRWSGWPASMMSYRSALLWRNRKSCTGGKVVVRCWWWVGVGCGDGARGVGGWVGRKRCASAVV